MRAERIERAALILILLVVGGLAAKVSFTHVHDWTMENSPAGTDDFDGWTNAVISELVPIAALLVIRQRRRAGKPIGYPVTLLVAAIALSLAAQLAVAKPSISGWLLSAVPALAFIGLTKLVLSAKPEDVKPAKPFLPSVPASPAADVPSLTDDVRQPPKRVTPAVVTHRAKVEKAWLKSPEKKPAEIAVLAGVSESTARRYQPKTSDVTSPSDALPAETATTAT